MRSRFPITQEDKEEYHKHDEFIENKVKEESFLNKVFKGEVKCPNCENGFLVKDLVGKNLICTECKARFKFEGVG